MKKYFAFLACAMIVVCMFAILSVSFYAEAASGINYKSKTLEVGETVVLKVNGAKKVKWSSANKKIASVDSKGKVWAEKKGKTTITAKVGNKKYTCSITVKKATPPEIDFKCLTGTKGYIDQIKIRITNNSKKTIKIYKWASIFVREADDVIMNGLHVRSVSDTAIIDADKEYTIKPGKTVTVTFESDTYEFYINGDTYYEIPIYANIGSFTYLYYPDSKEGYYK